LRRLLHDWVHLIRPAIVIVAAVGVFMAVRAAVIPESFGRYGHYDPGALEAARRHPIAFAGQQACADCHDEQSTARKAGKHAHVACEACHGPLAKHAADPSVETPKLPEVGSLCRSCHERDAAKPRWFPQVVSAEHSSGAACNACHKPHNPHL
jgi:hypothetical protein